MPKVTMDDVARKASVSIATVSRVYTDPDKVSPKNREKVFRAIEELNYQPNALARNLRRLQTNTILIIIPNIVNTFFTFILKSIQDVAFENNYQVLLGDTDRSLEREEQYLYLLQQKLVDGVILLFPRLNPSLIEEIVDNHPVVIVGQPLFDSKIPTVTNDTCLSTQIATEHLIKLGHSKIAYFSGPLNFLLSHDRLKGFRLAMVKHGLKIDESFIFEGDFYFQSGYELAAKMLSLPDLPTALVAGSDEMAIGAIKAARALGKVVPRDLAVIGFDDIKMASICEPSLSTMAQPADELGRISTEMLLALIKGETIKERFVLLYDKLVIRESCGFKKV
ncbi:LacI family DNA-binding transcriptional regulator [Paenibacillus filicis]|uniref:LacI family DNA-binding transcriptional regulator n=1 Tax=Paenibacillus gyeongsangnamensis TaxID=3388067 RepID=A0ABT4QF15_9BACL|nr:LacI family DNA-binding transcriptional regulator [Paenibacillus filicis]MCZ8515444.1 LacI family DNA-binding transcriptional regulator [Paenibacillus filicis]